MLLIETRRLLFPLSVFDLILLRLNSLLKMKLTQEALKIDVEKTTKIIEQFIRDTMKELNREGICVPISGIHTIIFDNTNEVV